MHTVVIVYIVINIVIQSVQMTKMTMERVKGEVEPFTHDIMRPICVYNNNNILVVNPSFCLV